MTDLHRVYLDLGSNLEPEKNIPLAIKLLCDVGEIAAVSSVWETESVGYAGPNFLNVCVLLLTPLDAEQIKYEINRPIEAQMGRVRGKDKNAPRPIDIDIVLFDETLHNTQTWDQAFVIVPLAELLPEFKTHSGKKLSVFAEQLQSQVWMRKREDVAISATVLRRG
jgi:2-amino-4-hydroxy-6-hydroxymethyldihydropteridine diphosphokinase